MNLKPNSEPDPDPPAQRSRRAAAQTARDHLMAQALESDDRVRLLVDHLHGHWGECQGS